MQPRHAALLVALAAPTLAQVPVGWSARTSLDPSGGGAAFGLELVDAVGSGSSQFVFGLSPGEFNAIALDPVSGDVVLAVFGSLTPGYDDGDIVDIDMSGFFATGTNLLADVGANPVQAIAFGPNGELFAVEDTVLHRIERGTGAVTSWDTISGSLGTFNALACDRASQRLFAATYGPSGGPGLVLEYDLSAGPVGPATTVDVTSFGLSGFLAGATCGGNGNLYLSSFDLTGQSVQRYRTATGTANAVPGAPLEGIQALDWDPLTGRLHCVAGTTLGADNYYLFAPAAGQLVTLSLGVDPGLVSDVAVNGFRDTTEVFPLFPSASTAFTVEAAAHGNAGELAGVALTALNGVTIAPLLLGIGGCDSAGFYTVSVPVSAGLFSAGDTLSILSGRLDGASGAVVYGDTKVVTLQP